MFVQLSFSVRLSRSNIDCGNNYRIIFTFFLFWWARAFYAFDKCRDDSQIRCKRVSETNNIAFVWKLLSAIPPPLREERKSCMHYLYCAKSPGTKKKIKNICNSLKVKLTVQLRYANDAVSNLLNASNYRSAKFTTVLHHKSLWRVFPPPPFVCSLPLKKTKEQTLSLSLPIAIVVNHFLSFIFPTASRSIHTQFGREF